MFELNSSQDKKIINFVKLSGKLKKLPRSGWLMKVGVKDPESVAEHIFGTSVLCMLIGDLKHIDTSKMIRMALLHDLCESITGDLMPGMSKRKNEDNAMKKILSYLPEQVKKYYHEIWNDYYNRKSEESEIVRELDKLEMAFQALYYEENGYDKRLLSGFWKTSDSVIKDPYVRQLFNSLKNEIKP